MWWKKIMHCFGAKTVKPLVITDITFMMPTSDMDSLKLCYLNRNVHLWSHFMVDHDCRYVMCQLSSKTRIMDKVVNAKRLLDSEEAIDPSLRQIFKSIFEETLRGKTVTHMIAMNNYLKLLQSHPIVSNGNIVGAVLIVKPFHILIDDMGRLQFTCTAKKNLERI